MSLVKRLVLTAGIMALAPGLADATTTTANLGVTLTVGATCTLVGGTIAFGNASVLTSPIPANGTLTVNCSNTTPFTVGLDQGLHGGSVTTRQMLSPTTAALVNYSLTQDAGHATNWGNSVGAWVAGTGAGVVQTITVYGLVAGQATPAPAADYADTVTITLTY